MARGTLSRLLILGMSLMQCCLWARSPNAGSAAGAFTETLQAGKAAEAEQSVQLALDRDPTDVALLTVLGDARFRRADFAGAAEAYSSALLLDAASARAHWGLGRVNEARSRHREAAAYFRQAFELDPRDKDILASYSQSRRFDPRLASDYKRYLLKLGTLRGGGQARGLVIEATIEGSGPLHLLLDTGARGILVNRSAVRDLRLSAVAESKIGGVGTPSGNATVAVARTVAFGPLRLADAVIEVTDTRLAPDVDGVVGFDTFAAFQIRIDVDASVLELLPFSEGGELRIQNKAATEFYGVRHLILVKAKVNREREGLFLVDTGAAFSSIAQEFMPSLHGSAAMLLAGPCGSQVYGYRAPAVKFELGGHALEDPAPIALDLRHMSRQEGIDISGIIGFPTLAKSRLTIDYRHGVFELEKMR